MLIFDVIIGMLFISGISMAALGLYGKRFVGRVPAATPYVLLMFAAAAWAVLYALDLLTASLPIRISFHNLRFLVLPFFSILELWLVITYVKRTEWLRRDWAFLALIIPVTAAILGLISPYHDLFRYNFSINTSGPIPILQYSESAFYAFYTVYSLILLVLAVLILVMESRKQGILRGMQTLLLLLALSIPTVINYAFSAGITPVAGVNLTPALFWVPAMLYTVALFRYRFLDIVPIARSRLIDTMDSPVLVLDTGGRIVDMNPAACSLFSFALSSALGKKIEEIVLDWPNFLSLCRFRGAQRVDLVRVRQSGVQHYTGSTEPLLTRNGEIEAQLILLRDITGKKNAEDALQKRSHELAERVKELNIIFEIARLVETCTSLDTLFQAIAEAIPSAWQYPELTCARIVIDKSEYVSKNYKLSSRKMEAPVVVHGKIAGKIEIRFLGETGDAGQHFFQDEEADLLRAIAERVGRVLERKQAESALYESEEKYRSIIENMQDLFYRTDLIGKITMVSPAGAKLAGYNTTEELIGQDAAMMYANPADREKFMTVLRQNGSVSGYPATLKIRDGTIRNVTTSSHFYRDAGGTVQGVEGVIHDITDKQRAEDALRMANKKLNLLSSITRHDIRNQLMALMTYLQLCEESVDKPAQLAEFIIKEQKIVRNIERQISFTKDYEDMGVNAPVWQNVSACVERAAAELPLRDLRIDKETSGLEVYADSLLEKVFYNLIDNALRYGGVALTTIRITTRAAGTALVLVFEDDGTGVDAEDKPQLFSKGFGKNTGLGLFLSKEILFITAITIIETGIPDKGARFEMTIPAGGFRFLKADS